MTLAEPDAAVVAEVLVHLRPPAFRDGTPVSRDRAFAFLHRTLDASGNPGAVRGAEVVVRRTDGTALHLEEAPDVVACAADFGFPRPGTCYGPLTDVRFEGGETLELDIRLADGGVLTSVTTVPERIALAVPAAAPCALPPLETLELKWSRSAGSAAYLVETSIAGLRAHFGPEVDVPDPLQVLGLAIGANDTTLVFPSEVGVFDRGDLDRELSVLLQQGLPRGVEAEVVVAAVDANFVNWVRGGNFNPSGIVRVPSVEGDGTGFFGSAASVSTTLRVPEEPDSGLTPCHGG